MKIKEIHVREKMLQPNRFQHQKPKFVPCIMFSGQYLQKLGFSINDRIEISSENPGQLQIKKVSI